LRKDVPVKWIINAKQLTQCNRVIVVSNYGLRIELQAGIQTVEFTPTKAGVVAWSCWMGMIPGTFIVVDDTPPAANLIHQVQEKWREILIKVEDAFAQ